MEKTKVFLAVPSIGTIYDAQVYAIEKMKERYKDEIELVRPELLVNRIFHDYARNSLVDEFLESDCDILWFLDSDIGPNPDVLDIITKHKDEWKVAGAPYPVFVTPEPDNPPQIVFTVYNKDDRGRLSPARIPHDGTDYVDGVATGCLFIKREVFEELEKPYFEFKYDKESRCLTEGEDLGFCKKLNKLGYKFFIDYAKVCKHRKNVDLLDVNNYAITYSNRAVQAYDENIRGKVEALASKVANSSKEPPAPKKSKGGLIFP